MLAADETALICDFAETYGVYDYRTLPLKTAAALAAGLSIDSRIKRKMSGTKISTDTALLALIADGVHHLIWMLASNSDSLQKPASIYEALTGQKKSGEVAGFDSGDEFLRRWRE